MIPVDPKLFQDIVAVVKARNPTYIPANGTIPSPLVSNPSDVMVETRTDEEKAQV